MSGMLAKGAAPLDAATLATLKREIERKGQSADKLRRQLVPVVSGATFHRALQGLKVSLPVQRACAALAHDIVLQRPMVVATIREQGHVVPPHGKAFTLSDAQPAQPYDFDPDPEAA